ncbi:E3 ubiquitin-protein ligase TRIM39-like [Gastrophryne carolinensis]
MASDVRDELKCSICLTIYTNPVTLNCGHNYCHDCIKTALSMQRRRYEDYRCPQCRKRFRRKPILQRNTNLCNIADRFKSREQDLHLGHRVETLVEASVKKKEKLVNVLKNLIAKKEETRKRVQNLQEHERKVKGKNMVEMMKAMVLFTDIKRQLEDLEKMILNEISRKEEQVAGSAAILIHQLEIKKDIISRQMQHVEEMCNTTDPLIVLQDKETDKEEYINTQEDETDLQNHIHDPDTFLISRMLHQGLSDIMEIKNARFPTLEPTDIKLDLNTASNNIHVSRGLKTASWTDVLQIRPENSERFHYPQVLSTNTFSSGQHYWQVETSKSGDWGIGVCYPSIDRGSGQNSLIGYNNKSWCIERSDRMYVMRHCCDETLLIHNFSSHRLGIFLDYEIGQLSFYELCVPIRHLHTFNAAFTEPLCVGLYLYKSDNHQRQTWIRMLD